MAHRITGGNPLVCACVVPREDVVPRTVHAGDGSRPDVSRASTKPAARAINPDATACRWQERPLDEFGSADAALSARTSRARALAVVIDNRQLMRRAPVLGPQCVASHRGGVVVRRSQGRTWVTARPAVVPLAHPALFAPRTTTTNGRGLVVRRFDTRMCGSDRARTAPTSPDALDRSSARTTGAHVPQQRLAARESSR